MSISIGPPFVPLSPGLAPGSADLTRITTTRASFIHHWFRARGRSLLTLYLTVVAVTYVPLLAAAVLDGTPLLTPTGNVRLPFLKDWNTAYMFLISLPCLAALTATDDDVLRVALGRVQRDGVLLVSSDAAGELATTWNRRFGRLNVLSCLAGLVVGAAVAWSNYLTYTEPRIGFWVAATGRLTASGYVFLWCIFVFYAAIPLFVFRTIGVSLLLREVVAKSELRMLPGHPDRCGGLRPVGQLGLRSQYALTVFGVNLVALVVVSVLYLRVPPILYALMVAAGIAYAVLGPIVFMGPLLPFRAGMLRAKSDLMSEVAVRLRIELLRLRTLLTAGEITRDDEELIERLKKIGAVIDELPVWPFDASTLRRFLTAYVIPMLGAAAYSAAQTIWKMMTASWQAS